MSTCKKSERILCDGGPKRNMNDEHVHQKRQADFFKVWRNQHVVKVLGLKCKASTFHLKKSKVKSLKVYEKKYFRVT